MYVYINLLLLFPIICSACNLCHCFEAEVYVDVACTYAIFYINESREKEDSIKENNQDKYIYIVKLDERQRRINGYAYMCCVLRCTELYGEGRFKGFEACIPIMQYVAGYGTMRGIQCYLNHILRTRNRRM